MPYTYLIGWSKFNKFYYGVRFAKNCHPSDLWVKYFTSSKFVKEFRKNNGEPDIIQIRKTFDNSKNAKNWEERVLRRLEVRKHDHWLNQAYPNSLRGAHVPWNTGLTKESSSLIREIGNKISKTRSSRTYVSSRKGQIMPEQIKNADSWRQLSANNQISQMFNCYEEFVDYCLMLFNSRKGVEEISRILNISTSGIIKALKSKGIISPTNQTWTKLQHKLLCFNITSYEQYIIEVENLLLSGQSICSISKRFGLSEDSIKRVKRLMESK